MVTQSCDQCNGVCCRYVSTEIDDPDDQLEYENIRWFLLHDNVSVYIDHDDDWIVEFQAKCSKLGEDSKCTYYDKRPQICRDHDIEDCDKFGEGEPHKVRFETVEEFEDYMKKNYKVGTQKTYEKIED